MDLIQRNSYTRRHIHTPYTILKLPSVMAFLCPIMHGIYTNCIHQCHNSHQKVMGFSSECVPPLLIAMPFTCLQ